LPIKRLIAKLPTIIIYLSFDGSLMPKPLPVGIQTFRDIIDGGFLYIDKTRSIYPLIRYSKGVYFLSRPRRFGKSLLISTLEEIFTGRRGRFRGLWLMDAGDTADGYRKRALYG
jgi:hypothetical protein